MSKRKFNFRMMSDKESRQMELLRLFDKMSEPAQTAMLEFLQAMTDQSEGGDTEEQRQHAKGIQALTSAAKNRENPFGLGNW